MLMDASHEKDGTGLTVVFTEEEEEIICRDYGLAVGNAICHLIGNEIKKENRESKFKYTYTNRTFQTSSI